MEEKNLNHFLIDRCHIMQVRNLIRSVEFDVFYESLDDKIKEKIDYVLLIMTEIKIVSTKFVKKLEGTDFYEMRISTDNEYRVIIFVIDNENFISSNKILLLNGFLKKSRNDYKSQIKIAEKILKKYSK